MKRTVLKMMAAALVAAALSGCGGSGQANNAGAQAVAAEETVETGKVATPLPVVYQLPNGRTKVLPHLDLNLKDNVIGILSGGMCVGLKTRIGNWMTAKGSENAKWKLPATDDGEKFFPERDGFDKTAAILRENGIDADPWSHSYDANSFKHYYYWTNVESRGNLWAYYFSMNDVKQGWFVDGPKGPHQSFRLVRKDVKK
jgi:predicted small lipoprotein YifL